VVTRLLDSTRGRWPRALLLPFLLLLAVPGPLAAQDSSWGLSLAPEDDLALAPAERVDSKRPCLEYRLLPGESRDCEGWMASVDLAAGTPFRIAMADAELPQVVEARQPNRLLGTIIPFASVGLVAANSLIGYNGESFHVNNEGWFQSNTRDGGADKASHFADYYIVAKEVAFVYEKLGYSENAARWFGFGVAISTGMANEISDGFTRHGFSWQDFAMDSLGAGTAVLVSMTRTQDLLGVRTSHVPGSTYTHDVYSADLKLVGLGKRLGIQLGPLRWLNFSVTYGSKGYRVEPPTELERQVGFEIGLNLQQILDDVGVKRNTWWGYALHLVGDNVRFPYTAIGMRYDMNHGRWRGPNTGNYQ
jgi:uncharacterized protein YfiM (DUF2279 family)